MKRLRIYQKMRYIKKFPLFKAILYEFTALNIEIYC